MQGILPGFLNKSCATIHPILCFWLWYSIWRKKQQLTPAVLPGKSHRQRSLEGYSPWSCRRVRPDLATKQQQNSWWKAELIQSPTNYFFHFSCEKTSNLINCLKVNACHYYQVKKQNLTLTLSNITLNSTESVTFLLYYDCHTHPCHFRVVHSFSLLCSHPVIEYDTFYLFPIDIYVDWLQFGDTKSNVVMNWSFGAHR